MGGKALRVAAASPALLLMPHVQPPEPSVLARIVVSTKPAAWPSLSVGVTTVTTRWTFLWGWVVRERTGGQRALAGYDRWLSSESQCQGYKGKLGCKHGIFSSCPAPQRISEWNLLFSHKCPGQTLQSFLTLWHHLQCLPLCSAHCPLGSLCCTPSSVTAASQRCRTSPTFCFLLLASQEDLLWLLEGSS